MNTMGKNTPLLSIKKPEPLFVRQGQHTGDASCPNPFYSTVVNKEDYDEIVQGHNDVFNDDGERPFPHESYREMVDKSDWDDLVQLLVRYHAVTEKFTWASVYEQGRIVENHRIELEQILRNLGVKT